MSSPQPPATAAFSPERLLRDNMAEGFCVIDIVYDAQAEPMDYVTREVNAAYEHQTGLRGIVGRRMGEVLPGQDPRRLQAFARVARTGKPERFEQRSERLGRWYEVHAFAWPAPGEQLVGVLFNDITQRRLDELMAQSVVEYAIILLDATGHVRTWNAGAQRIKGYTREEILGKHLSVFYTPEDRALNRPAQVLARAADTGRFDDEGWRVRRDGTRFWGSVAVTPLRDADGQLQGFCKVTRDLTERKHAQEQLHRLNASLEAEVQARTEALTRANAQLRDAKERLQDLSARLIRAQEQERGRIARELHDDTGQILTLMRMRLAEFGQTNDVATLDSCTDLVNDAIDHTRRLALNLRPAILDDLGLDAALEWMLGQQAAAAAWSASYHGSVGEQRFAEEVETACFRICQEALTNAVRYAGAKEVSVSLRLDGDRLLLEVKDDGRGFDVAHFRSPQERTRHFGLLSMEERAALVGAQLAIVSAPGQGTRVTASFPARER